MNVQQMYSLGLNEIKDAIMTLGHLRTILVRGHMGIGKSSLLKMMAAENPGHHCVYFDCTTKDVGDLAIPTFHALDANGYARFVPHEELGLHLNRDVILMIDEFGKGNEGVKRGLLRLMLEREFAGYKLTPDSKVFATTNLNGEGLGDMLAAHALNRLTLLNARKPSAVEWLAWGLMNNIHPAVLRFAESTPQAFASWEDYPSALDSTGNPANPYIFHPQAPAESFVTPRSLHAASDWCWQRDAIGDQTLTAGLIGTIGARAALDLMTFIKVVDEMPSVADIKAGPMTAKVPRSPAAAHMVVYRSLSQLDVTWADQWMDYLSRLDSELQQYFARKVMDMVTGKNPQMKMMFMVKNRKFVQWSLANNFSFTNDK
jgi:hypothetical protein